MWHVCNPKSDDDLKQCAELGKSLSRMSQPTILTVLASSAAKRMFSLTPEGRAALRRWIDALACYMATIQELREEAADALGIPVPPRPVCGGHE